jgi:DnaJ-class molecular chaperone
MENYYDLFEVSVNSSFNEIIMSYENKITKFNNIKKLNKNQIKEIKLLKAGLYVLTDNNLRKKYNSFINKKFNYTENREPSAPNQDEDMNSNLDDLFKVDNTWMGNIDEKIGDKKEKLDSNMLSSRIFSMSELNNRPTFPADFESELRKPQQGRPDKSTTN